VSFARVGAVLIVVAAFVPPGRAGTSAGGNGLVVASGGPARAHAVTVFDHAMIHLHPDSDSASVHVTPGVAVDQNGRIISTEVVLPDSCRSCRIIAKFALHPVPKDDRSMHDRWDRAGNVRLAVDGAPDLEIARFMTSYGGRTDHEVDVSELAPLLRGRRTFRAFVDTWVSPAWRIDAALEFRPDTLYDAPVWAAPVFYTDSFNRKEHEAGVEAPVDVPTGLARVVLRYVSTGHCTDGRDEDEFVSKPNVISVDGVVVARVHPWRDDCRRFRERNPYCARWADGSWSSDYSRSGWCPGDAVRPMEFDLTDHLTPGRHTIRFAIEGIRPADADGQFGYWRVSAALIGWDHPPKLWRN